MVNEYLFMNESYTAKMNSAPLSRAFSLNSSNLLKKYSRTFRGTSQKNIPIPLERSYKLQLMDKIDQDGKLSFI